MQHIRLALSTYFSKEANLQMKISTNSEFLLSLCSVIPARKAFSQLWNDLLLRLLFFERKPKTKFPRDPGAWTKMQDSRQRSSSNPQAWYSTSQKIWFLCSLEVHFRTHLHIQEHLLSGLFLHVVFLSFHLFLQLKTIFLAFWGGSSALQSILKARWYWTN